MNGLPRARAKVIASAAGGLVAGAVVLAIYITTQSPGEPTGSSAPPSAAPSDPGESGAASGEPASSAASAQPASSPAHPAPALPLPHAIAVAALDPAACEAELERRRIPFAKADGERVGTVRQPMRLAGPIEGVTFEPSGLASSAKPHPYDIADCRLLVALSGLARVAKEQHIASIEFFGMYRPSRSRGPSSTGRHEEGLAIDIGAIRVEKAEPLVVLEAFRPNLGKRPCPPKQDAPDDYGAQALRSLACATFDAQIFNVVLTPNEGPSHKDHFHFDLTQGVTWFHLE